MSSAASNITSILKETRLFPPPADFVARAHVKSRADYERLWQRAKDDPEGFWAEQAKRIHWTKPFSKVKNTSFGPGNVSIKWFEDGVTNVAYNCIDRHLAKRGDQVAII